MANQTATHGRQVYLTAVSRQYKRMSDRSDELLVRWLHEQVQRVARIAARHRTGVDLLIAVAIAALSLSGLGVQGRLGHPAVIVFCVALCAPLPLRRWNRPLCFALVALVALIQWFTSTPQLADLAVLVALYWVALDGELTEIAVAAVVVESGAIMAATRWSPSEPVKVWVGLSGLAVAAGVLGITIRQRRALLASLKEKAARLEFERDQEGRLGAARERARIAREMHDIVSHNLTVMIGLADGATYALDSSPQRALSAIQRVSATGRQALVEMRRLLGVLGDEPDAHPLEPQPGLDRLDELLARVDAAGIPVTIELEGAPRELSGGVQLAVFRVAQEALTNTLKHAERPAQAHVVLRCRSGDVELEITDTGPGTGDGMPARAPEVLGGRGLRGMRERAAAYGGRLEAGPRPEGGWRVHLSLTADATSPVS
jgi:signal transduction histidine kinase